MADHAVTRSKHSTLTASTVDKITFDGDFRQVAVSNRGSAAIYATLSSKTTGDNPTVGGDNTFLIDAGETRVFDFADEIKTVRLISSGTPAYSVEGF